MILRDGPFDIPGGGGAGLGYYGRDRLLFFFCQKTRLFFQQVESQDIFFSNKVKAGFFWRTICIIVNGRY